MKRQRFLIQVGAEDEKWIWADEGYIARERAFTRDLVRAWEEDPTEERRRRVRRKREVFWEVFGLHALCKTR